MKIISYNVNGIRAAINKEFFAWLQATEADIVCLQEIKATPDQIVDIVILENLGYKHYWFPAEKKGYSGTAIFSKIEPNHVEYGCGIEDYDREGRIIRADFNDFSIISAYFPSGSSGDIRQDFKYKFLDDIAGYIDKLKIDFPKLIIQNLTPIHRAFYQKRELGWKVSSIPAL
jgi:exodeoxyribonuclease-3